MKNLVLAAILVTIALPSGQAWALSSCKLQVHAVDDQGELVSPYVLGPEHVESIEPFDSGLPDDQLWQVALTPEGANINSYFSAERAGKQIAILCDGVEIVRPFVRGGSHESFVFSTPGRS